MQFTKAGWKRLERQLIGIRIHEWHMITMKMTEHHISSIFQYLQYFLAYPAPYGYLKRMGKQAVPHIAQCYARIDDNAPIRQCHQAAKAAYAHGFRTDDLDTHGHCFRNICKLLCWRPLPATQ